MIFILSPLNHEYNCANYYDISRLCPGPFEKEEWGVHNYPTSSCFARHQTRFDLLFTWITFGFTFSLRELQTIRHAKLLGSRNLDFGIFLLGVCLYRPTRVKKELFNLQFAQGNADLTACLTWLEPVFGVYSMLHCPACSNTRFVSRYNAVRNVNQFRGRPQA